MKRSLFSGVVAGAGLVVWASASWGCTPTAAISVERPAGVITPRQELRVHGSSFNDRLPVEIRWDKAEGPLLATSKGPSFDVAVQVPADAPGGPHLFVAVQHDATGTVIGKTADVVQLAGDAPSLTPAWDGATPVPAPQPAGTSAPLFLAIGTGAAAAAGLGLVVATRRRVAAGSAG